MNRRSMIAGAAASLPLAFAGSTIVLPSPEGRIETLFHQWREAYTEFELGGLDGDDSPAWSRLKEIEEELFEIKPTTLRQFAIKVLVAMNYKHDGGCHVDCDLVFHAEAIVGLPKPYGLTEYRRDKAAGGTA